jgi:hypothetical protein
MYYSASSAAGAVVAVMVVQNGALADSHGPFGSTVLVHAGGSSLSRCACSRGA